MIWNTDIPMLNMRRSRAGLGRGVCQERIRRKQIFNPRILIYTESWSPGLRQGRPTEMCTLALDLAPTYLSGPSLRYVRRDHGGYA
jgi:hypothetical protein